VRTVAVHPGTGEILALANYPTFDPNKVSGSTEIQRRNIPNTYTASGQRAAPGPRNIRPLAVSRSL
jgi:cell division protein FtsI/penicillin-binding protein 2